MRANILRLAIPLLLGAAGAGLLTGAATAREVRGHLDTEDLPSYLRDRGEGIPSSMFGTYIQPKQLLVYAYFEYYRDADYEYSPNELGFTQDKDFRGDYKGSEWLLFLGYGLSDRLALELEAAAIDAELKRSGDDVSGVPPTVAESGIGDVETQLRWRWAREGPGRPEVFSYFETVLPTQDRGSLIGTTDWELKLGTGLVRGYGWGTATVRASIEYDRSERSFGLGEFALEYLRRLSSTWRVYGGVEGTGDEIELITEAQIHFSRRAFLKLNSAFGLTSKATDWAPEVGVMFAF
jgi:hypothetical protein